MPNSTFYILHSKFNRIFSIAIIIILLMLISSCDKSTSPKTGSISGTVVLLNDSSNPDNNPIDFSGVTVTLYSTTVVDTALFRINVEYPQIGVQVGQQTEFDHTMQSHISSTTTDSEGNYDLQSVAEGSYNLVFSKAGYGWRYEYNVEINKVINDTLFTETTLDLVYYEQLLLKRNRHYLIPRSLTVGTLEVEGNCWVRYKNEAVLMVVSNIITKKDEYSYFISESMLSQGCLLLNTIGNVEMEYLVFRRMTEAIKIVNSTATISHMRFHDCGISVNSGNSEFSLKNITADKSDNTSNILETDSSIYILDSSVLIGSYIAVDSRNTSEGIIKHSFIRSQQCAYLDAYTVTKIQNCQLEAAEYAIKSMQSYLVQILDSNIVGYRGIFIRLPKITSSNCINGNNIYTASYALENSPNIHIQYQDYYFNAKNNYFNTTDVADIEAKVFDLYDQPTWYLFNFDYTPFRTSANPAAGI